MKFSILVANYNNAPFIDECIESVINQTYPIWELIIIDDCSTDNSISVLKKWESCDNRIKLFYNEFNQGCGFTKRECVLKSSGDLAAFLDPDDALVSNALEVMVKEHEKFPNSSLIHSTHYICDPVLNIEKVNDRCGKVNRNLLLNRETVVSHFACFRTDKYFRTPGINSELKRSVDQDLYYLMEETGELYFVPLPLYLYRIHTKGISSLGKNPRKAMYWHLLVQESAYARRKGTKLEIPYSVLKIRWQNYYHSLIDEAIREKNWKKFLFGWCSFPLFMNVYGFRTKISILKKFSQLIKN